jgi:hypothetical protein
MGSLTIDSFATDSAAVPGTGARRLAELAARIVELQEHYPGASVRVVGHTDAVGAEAHNETLGQRRAEAVRDALVAGGAPSGIILTESGGETAPAVPSRGPNARNRRVVVTFEPEPRFGAGFDLRLTPPTRAAPPGEGERPPIDLRLPTSEIFRPETPAETAQRILRPIPPAPGRGPVSVTDRVNSAIDRAINPLIRGLPEWAQSAIREGAHSAVSRGTDALLNSALEQAGVPSTEREAIRRAVEAAQRTTPTQ